MATQKQIFHGVKRLSELVIKSGLGSRVITHENKSYLDFTSGIGVVSTGHCHPTVVAAVREQAGQIVHAQQSNFYSAKMLELIDRLNPIVPKGLDSFFFANSGAEAVEGAVRLARQATGKDNVIVFRPGYHGRTIGLLFPFSSLFLILIVWIGTLALTSSGAGYRGNRLGPSPSGTVFVNYPYEFLGPNYSSDAIMAELDLVLKTQSPVLETCAVLIEPVLGEGGYVPAPFPFMRQLRAFCDKHGLLLLADEIQTGYGRTGLMFAVEHSQVIPDVLIMAKGIASGYPLSAVATRRELSDKQLKGSMGGTYGGNAVACAAAIATLDVFAKEDVLGNVNRRGAQLTQGLRNLQKKHSFVKDVRGLGLMIGCELDSSDATLAADISKACLDRSMLVHFGLKFDISYCFIIIYCFCYYEYQSFLSSNH
jgi:4-aminobutyrate aminotransferase